MPTLPGRAGWGNQKPTYLGVEGIARSWEWRLTDKAVGKMLDTVPYGISGILPLNDAIELRATARRFRDTPKSFPAVARQGGCLVSTPLLLRRSGYAGTPLGEIIPADPWE
jgi:hypothetical protein